MFFVCDELYLWSYKSFWPGKGEGIFEEGDSVTLNLLLLTLVKMMASRRLQLICILKHDGPGITQISKVYSLAEVKMQKSSALTQDS
jgi:hypothetical protein